jgi:hypothetical protein
MSNQPVSQEVSIAVTQQLDNGEFSAIYWLTSKEKAASVIERLTGELGTPGNALAQEDAAQAVVDNPGIIIT